MFFIYFLKIFIKNELYIFKKKILIVFVCLFRIIKKNNVNFFILLFLLFNILD